MWCSDDGPRIYSGLMSQRSVLVTGGGSGIGLAAALHFADAGDAVTVCGRSEDRLASACAGTSMRHVVCDVTDEGQVEAAVAFAREPTGGLDVCVASAGGGTIGPVVALPVEEWRRVVDLNLTGTFITLKHAGATIADSGGGAFVAVSSLAASITHRHMAPYCAAKAGVEMLVKVAADELGARGVRVNAIAPSFVGTELMMVVAEDEVVVSSYLDNMAVRRLGGTGDTTDAIAFLASGASSWITGEVIRVDGGHHLRAGPSYDHISAAIYGDA